MVLIILRHAIHHIKAIYLSYPRVYIKIYFVKSYVMYKVSEIQIKTPISHLLFMNNAQYYTYLFIMKTLSKHFELGFSYYSMIQNIRYF